MKHLFTLLIVLSSVVAGQSQWWFDIGAKGAFGPTLMYDNNSFDSGSHKHKLTTGYAYGGRLGFNYGYHVGLSLEYNLATSKQDFELNSDLFNQYKLRHNDVVGVFRYSGNGAYVEVGAKYSKIKEVELENADVSNVIDATPYFEKNYMSGILGFGSYLMGDDLFTVNLGIRMHWGFDDIVSAEGKENNVPLYGTSEQIDPSEKVRMTAAQLQLEVNYAFGRFAKSACHDRWRLILFQ